MRYVYVARDTGFGAFGAWYDALASDVLARTAAWARSVDPSLTGSDIEVLARIAQPPELGGGFIAGGIRMCLANTSSGRSEPMRAADVPCPPGSGGIGGSQVQELTADQVRAIIEENKRREAEERAFVAGGGGVRRVEVYGIVVDGLGMPVVGASVELSGVRVATTAGGEFTADVVPGTYTMTVRASGYQDRVLNLVTVRAATPLDTGRIMLIRSATYQPPSGESSDTTGDGTPKEDGGNGAAAPPWYKSTGLWVGVAVVTVGGVGYLIWRSRKGG